MRLHHGAHVTQALADARPVVALETTVITHGLAYPDNLHTALAMEAAVREAGACPATLGIVDGRIVAGMSEAQIEAFATADAGSIDKCSRRDLPVVIGRRRHGSLTVAGTLQVAHAAGIPIMATGGIGGVHRGAPQDVSADLIELGRTPVACVCAGAKSILDLPRTLEVLETQGVPVVGLGTPTLPAFFCADSGLPLPATAATLDDAAAILAAWRRLGAANGLLLTVPVPAGQALPMADAEAAIATALAEADARGIAGSAITPFVLRRVGELTDGRSVAANKALLVHNAATAATLAVRAALVPARG